MFQTQKQIPIIDLTDDNDVIDVCIPDVKLNHVNPLPLKQPRKRLAFSRWERTSPPIEKIL